MIFVFDGHKDTFCRLTCTDQSRVYYSVLQDLSCFCRVTVSQLQQGSASAVKVMKDSLVESDNSVKQAHVAGDKMAAVTTAIKAIDDVNHGVANATTEQNEVIQSLDNDIHTISELSQQGQLNLNNTLAECTRLKQQFDELEKMVLRFKV